MKKLFTLTLLAFSIFTLYSPISLAENKHDGHGAAHGGQFFEDKNHHGIEMVVKDKEIIFYMTSDGKPLDMSGAKFKAVIQTDAGTEILNLTSEKNILKAKLKAKLSKGSKIAVTGKDGHGDVLQARFVKE